MIRRVKGTQDFLDLTLFNFFIAQSKEHLAQYHFNEIATPIIEPTELFKRSLGLETDIVTKEMYTLNTESESICLRPEGTASTVRAFIENGIQTVPWKVFLWGPMFRHERPQKGRYRQFHQLSLEVIGSDSIAQDAHMIAMLDRLFSDRFKLDSYALHINFLGTMEDRAAFRKILEKFLNEHVDQICATCKVRKDKNIMRVYDCKEVSCQTLYRKAPVLTEYLSKASADEWQQLQEYLDSTNVAYTVMPTLVRGLDYYNKTVFEFVSPHLGAQSAFCGGGRYDHLVSALGGKKDQPSVGAAIGIERMLLLLDPIKDALPIYKEPRLHVIMPLSTDQHTLALLIAYQTLQHGLYTEVLLEGDSVKSMMRKANKLGATYCLLIGSEEQDNKTVKVKHMTTGEEATVAHADLIAYLQQ
ncbi:histidine--tRNA ligase [Candidatus Babeliales bacterium]|nr:histidine--tRNA ligase [Candidatus Babeliales bacterium]